MIRTFEDLVDFMLKFIYMQITEQVFGVVSREGTVLCLIDILAKEKFANFSKNFLFLFIFCILHFFSFLLYFPFGF